MKSSAISVIQGPLSQKNANVAVLRNGTIVTARILSKNSDGTFTLSLAGQKINVKSEALLKIGSTISAKVSLAGKEVQLSLIKENPESNEIFQKFSAQTEISPQIANLLTSLGFEPNIESLKILQFMQQLGIKINAEEAKKTLAKSKSNGKTDQEKAEFSLLLEEKGMEMPDKRINALLGHSERQNHHSEQNSSHSEQSHHHSGQSEGFRENCLKSVKSYFSAVDKASLKNSPGPLSAFNTILSKNKENSPLRHWLLLPFEWEAQKSYGNIKLLFDSELKKLQKVIIDLKNAEKNNIFVLYYKNQEVDSLSFATSEKLPDSKKSALCERLSKMFGQNFPVRATDFEELKGFCPGDEEIKILNGMR